MSEASVSHWMRWIHPQNQLDECCSPFRRDLIDQRADTGVDPGGVRAQTTSGSRVAGTANFRRVNFSKFRFFRKSGPWICPWIHPGCASVYVSDVLVGSGNVANEPSLTEDNYHYVMKYAGRADTSARLRFGFSKALPRQHCSVGLFHTGCVMCCFHVLVRA